MSQSTLQLRPLLPVHPSDADLLATTASLMQAMPGPLCGPLMSRLLELVCGTFCPGPDEDRAEQLSLALADYLWVRRVLHHDQVSPDALDAWVARTPIVFVRAALRACARFHQPVERARRHRESPESSGTGPVERDVVGFDWSHPSHWSPVKKPCRICGTPTNTRDDQDRPCDQECAKAEAVRERLGRRDGGATAGFADERVRPSLPAEPGTATHPDQHESESIR